ncbi:hypothetical protein VIBR0546_09434 [Vibrio brasiliensis LMG 20546]|uniref:Uncharacterized protein n=1 Tax=Vibrio brasiliensis LMG 20546 TaxID=945543 RepID=E8M0H8_9VIBR|nr:hypothetical protein VIBR0546_09434 [Vibrio brasiliensis LMG 20546]
MVNLLLNVLKQGINEFKRSKYGVNTKNYLDTLQADLNVCDSSKIDM